MSKKHFEQLADAMAKSRPSDKQHKAAMAQWLIDVENVANVCSNNNSNFDYGLFVEACKTR